MSPGKRLQFTFLCVVFVAVVVGGPFVAGLDLGRAAGHDSGFAQGHLAGFQEGEASKLQEITELVEAKTALVQPVDIPDESSCSVLVLLAARAGELRCMQQVGYILH